MFLLKVFKQPSTADKLKTFQPLILDVGKAQSGKSVDKKIKNNWPKTTASFASQSPEFDSCADHFCDKYFIQSVPVGRRRRRRSGLALFG